MKLLFLAKRRPQQRDLLERPYGRFHHLPVALTRRGHDVRVLLCSHHGLANEQQDAHGVHWASRDFRRDGVVGTLRWLERESRSFAPDWIIGCSDAWYGWFAHRLTRRLGTRLAVDAYDNYEAYMPWNLPLHWRWRAAIAAADVVTAAGPQLAELLGRRRNAGRPVSIVPMAPDPQFVPHDRPAARASLGLPANTPLIGYIGSWAHNRGTDVILEAFRLIRKARGDSRLVLSGNPPEHALAEPGVIGLGYVQDAQLPLVLSALDVACVITAETAFGQYSYPAKLCEAMACGIPVVATATKPVQWMLGADPRFLAPVGDASGIAGRALDLLGTGQATYPSVPTWDHSAGLLEQALNAAG